MNYFNLFSFVEPPITKSLYYLYKVKNKFSKEVRVPILAYHNVYDPPKKRGQLPFYVPSSLFEKQMEFLHRNDYSVISLHDFLLFCDGRKEIPKKSVILTFDDGYKSIYRYAYPILSKYNYPATIFLAVGFIGYSQPFPWLNFRHPLDENEISDWLPLSWNEIIKMSGNLITFGSHSFNHVPFSTLSTDQIEREFKVSRKFIEGKIGNHVDLFSFPFSATNLGRKHRTKLLADMLEKYGYKGACTTRIGINKKSTDPFGLMRIQISYRDLLPMFRAKLIGAYSWVRFPQFIYNWHLRFPIEFSSVYLSSIKKLP